MTYYHGTSDIFEMGTYILPASCTHNLRESWRKKDLDVVFSTISYKSAYMYAKKAAEKYGGAPVVYRVIPLGNVHYRGGVEYGSNIAVIITKE